MKYVIIVLFLSSAFCTRQAEAHNDYRDGLYSDVRILELHNSWISGASCYCGTGAADPFISENPPVRYLWVWPRLPTLIDTLRADAHKRLAELMKQQARPVPEFLVDWKRVWQLSGLLLILSGLVLEFKAVSRLR